MQEQYVIKYTNDWQQAFGEMPPLAHYLRDANLEHWVRFHLLPEGKRYADTKDEKEEILFRYNEIASAVLGYDENSWLISNVTRQDMRRSKWARQYKSLHKELALNYISEWPHPEELDDPDMIFQTYAGFTNWRPGKFDAQLLKIADDQIRLLWFAPQKRRVFAPYDGGIDVLAQDAEFLSRLRNDYASWVPEGGW